MDDKLRHDEELWRRRLQSAQQRRDEVVRRAQQIEEIKRQKALQKIRAEEYALEAAKREQATAAYHRVVQRRSQSELRNERIYLQKQAEEAAVEHKRRVIDERLQESLYRRVQHVEGSQQRVARQRALREAVVEANQKKEERLREMVSDRSASRGSGNNLSSASRHRKSHIDEQVRQVVEKSRSFAASRVTYELQRQQASEQRSMHVLMQRQREIDERRMRKLQKEEEAKVRVRQLEIQREMQAQLYESRFLEAVELGNLVSAHNSICRPSFN